MLNFALLRPGSTVQVSKTMCCFYLTLFVQPTNGGKNSNEKVYFLGTETLTVLEIVRDAKTGNSKQAAILKCNPRQARGFPNLNTICLSEKVLSETFIIVTLPLKNILTIGTAHIEPDSVIISVSKLRLRNDNSVPDKYHTIDDRCARVRVIDIDESYFTILVHEAKSQPLVMIKLHLYNAGLFKLPDNPAELCALMLYHGKKYHMYARQYSASLRAKQENEAAGGNVTNGVKREAEDHGEDGESSKQLPSKHVKLERDTQS